MAAGVIGHRIEMAVGEGRKVGEEIYIFTKFLMFRFEGWKFYSEIVM